MILKKSRFNYWSCSKIADYIRGTIKPSALGWDEWEVWRKDAQQKYPYRYWLAEKFLDKLQDILNLPSDIYYTFSVYIRNRYIDKIQYLKTGLKPGTYYDMDHRILHGLFNELVLFVEKEQAFLMTAYKDKKYKFIDGRCKQAGLDYLDWACNLTLNEDYGYKKRDKEYGKPTAQAISSQKILELYNWWINRESRIDANILFSKEKDGKNYYKKIAKLEDEYYKEDTTKLIELIKIRRELWT